MKYLIHLFAVIVVIMLMTACSSEGAKTGTPAPAGTAEVDIDVTDAAVDGTQLAQQEAQNVDQPTDAPVKDDASYRSELITYRWKLSAVSVDGEAVNIGVQYGSVIRETGAYLAFNDDGTFSCVLGIPGCQGTYTVEDGTIKLHITEKYTGGSADRTECDEVRTVSWDHSADTLTFDYFGVSNVFSKSV